nr:MAG TPA: hypothetical protein [Caudoviricetes sp.]
MRERQRVNDGTALIFRLFARILHTFQNLKNFLKKI